MKLTSAEKLIIAMLADLHEKVGISNFDTKLIKNAIYTENTWALTWSLNGIINDTSEEIDTTPPEVSLVVDILDMWSFIEETYENFNQTQKDELKERTHPFGILVKFLGFDGNNESEYMSIANMLIKSMNRFTEFNDRSLNSHRPIISNYQRMLEKFLLIRPSLIGRHMSVDEMATVLSAFNR